MFTTQTNQNKSMLASLALVVACACTLSAESQSIHSQVKVTRSEPLYSNVSKSIPYDDCRDVREETGGASQGGGLVGGILGGVLGHQVGGGTGKTAATIGGAVIGTMMGANAGSTPKGYRVSRQCETRYRESTQTTQVGWTNYGILQGQEISVQSSERLQVIPVTVTFSY